MKKVKTYRGFWQDDHTKLVLGDVPADQVRANRPAGARVHPAESNTIGREDGGDEYEFAFFEVNGRVLVVIPTPGSAPPGET